MYIYHHKMSLNITYRYNINLQARNCISVCGNNHAASILLDKEVCDHFITLWYSIMKIVLLEALLQTGSRTWNKCVELLPRRDMATCCCSRKYPRIACATSIYTDSVAYTNTFTTNFYFLCF